MRTVVTALLLLLMGAGAMAQDAVKDRVVEALRTGNSSELAAQFIADVDLTLPGSSDVYSKAQAEQILRKFFNDHPPVGLVIEHSGVNKFGDQYFIGILRTRSGYFRTTFFLKKGATDYQVKTLRIEPSKNDL